jgi:hypothetical protein
MSNALNFRSVSPMFLVKSNVEKSPQFVFISINNPEDIKDPQTQKIIRHHARQNAERNYRKKKTQGGFHGSCILESATQPTKSTQTGALSHVMETAIREYQQHPTDRRLVHSHIGHEGLQSQSLDFLRPIGAGRGFNPFAPLPIKTTPRTVQLLDYRM